MNIKGYNKRHCLHRNCQKTNNFYWSYRRDKHLCFFLYCILLGFSMMPMFKFHFLSILLVFFSSCYRDLLYFTRNIQYDKINRDMGSYLCLLIYRIDVKCRIYCLHAYGALILDNLSIHSSSYQLCNQQCHGSREHTVYRPLVHCRVHTPLLLSHLRGNLESPNELNMHVFGTVGEDGVLGETRTDMGGNIQTPHRKAFSLTGFQSEDLLVRLLSLLAWMY